MSTAFRPTQGVIFEVVDEKPSSFIWRREFIFRSTKPAR